MLEKRNYRRNGILRRFNFFRQQLRLPMSFRTRLSLLSLETRENPSIPIAPPISSGAPATTAPATAAVSGAATATGATTPGSGQITSTGSVSVTTAVNIATSILIGGTTTTTT